MFKIKTLVLSISVLFATQSVFAEEITLLHVGDQESWLISSDGNTRSNYGGVDRLATVIANAETNAGANTVIKLNAGDALLPGPRFEASLDNLSTAYTDGGQDFYDTIAMRQIGFDATVFGNHEFDLGPTTAARFAEISGSTYLSVNLNFDATTEFSALKASGKVAPSKIITTVGGKKIGIVGATTPRLPSISSPGAVNLIGYNPNQTELQNLQSLIPIIQAEVNRLRNVEGVTTVILLSHLQSANNEINVVIPGLSGVDLVVSGGGHELMRDADDLTIPFGIATTFNSHPVFAVDSTAKSIPVVTSHFGNRYVGELEIEINDATGEMTGINSTRMIRVTDVAVAGDPNAVTGDATIKANVVDPVQEYVTALNAQVIGSSAVKLNGPIHTSCTPAPCTFVAGVRNAETGLGNLIADAMRFAGKTDVAIQNGGGIRASIPAPGNVSVGDTFTILPFTNLVKRAPEMNATQLKDILEHSVLSSSPTGGNNGRFAQVSGMQVIYDSTQTARASTSANDPIPVGTGSRIRRVVLDDGTVLIDNGVVVDEDHTFSFTTIDFTANGGDGYPFAANGVVFENSPFTITYQEALANYIQTPKSEGGLGRLNVADGDEITANMYGLENQYDNVGRLIDTSIAVTTPGVTRTGRATRDQLVGTNGDDTIVGGFGADILTGGPGADTFVYNSLRDARDVITDFTPYADKIKLTNLLQSLGVNSNEVDVFADGYILIKDITGGVALQIDRDGWFGRARPSTLVFIRGLTAAQIAPARDLILSEPVSSR
jgi:5'-nucleotidase/UDP-sugar diphosphatase